MLKTGCWPCLVQLTDLQQASTFWILHDGNMALFFLFFWPIYITRCDARHTELQIVGGALQCCFDSMLAAAQHRLDVMYLLVVLFASRRARCCS
jgi:hypothetical protein